MIRTIRPMAMLAVLALLGACGEQPDATAHDDAQPVASGSLTPEELAAEPPDAATTADSAGGATTTVDWDTLIPQAWRPEVLFEEYGADDLSDDDPRAAELMDKLQTLLDEAPVVEALDGVEIRLPGFVVPVEMDSQAIGEFLLVPYYGACIHTPPPPANQTVHVLTPIEQPYQGELFDTVWVTGVLEVESVASDLGTAGYRIRDAAIEPYE